MDRCKLEELLTDRWWFYFIAAQLNAFVGGLYVIATNRPPVISWSFASLCTGLMIGTSWRRGQLRKRNR